MKVTINNSDSGSTVRTNLNNMFTELYNAIDNYIQLLNVSANTSQAIPANTKVKSIAINVISGTPTVNIGTTDGAGEIIITSLHSGFNEFIVDEYYATGATYYIDASGGTVSIGIEIKQTSF